LRDLNQPPAMSTAATAIQKATPMAISLSSSEAPCLEPSAHIAQRSRLTTQDAAFLESDAAFGP
jgi:hypothetical protein